MIKFINYLYFLNTMQQIFEGTLDHFTISQGLKRTKKLTERLYWREVKGDLEDVKINLNVTHDLVSMIENETWGRGHPKRIVVPSSRITGYSVSIEGAYPAEGLLFFGSDGSIVDSNSILKLKAQLDQRASSLEGFSEYESIRVSSFYSNSQTGISVQVSVDLNSADKAGLGLVSIFLPADVNRRIAYSIFNAVGINVHVGYLPKTIIEAVEKLPQAIDTFRMVTSSKTISDDIMQRALNSMYHLSANFP